MFKSLIVGCGKIAGGDAIFGPTTHGGAYARSQRIELAAGIDTVPERARRFAGRFGCEYGSELISALEHHAPDVVSVCTPDKTHYEVVCEILSAPSVPRVIFLEKPACATKEQYISLEQLAAGRGSMIVANHSRRFDLGIQDLRERIAAGEFGRLERARAVYYSGWLHNGTHIVDTLGFVLNDTLRVDRILSLIKSPYPDDPTLEVQATLRKLNAPVLISAIDENLYQLFEFDFWFEGARLRLEDFGERVILEHQVVNEIGERVLEMRPNGLPERLMVPMEEAVSRIESYLASGDAAVLAGCRLEDIGPTMETLWEGQRLYEKTGS